MITRLTAEQVNCLENSEQALQVIGLGGLLNEIIDGVNAGGGSPAGAGGFIGGSLGVTAGVADAPMFSTSAAAFTGGSVHLNVLVAPTGADLIIDILYHPSNPLLATTIFTNPANRPRVVAGAFKGISGVPDVINYAEDGFFIPVIVQVGSSMPGSNLVWRVKQG